ncbi:DUF3048 domain-containing protein [Aeromicrobium sp.]|uniref:DUF3048 domain-containing protein n=1 Tax=Aeromicrobium sp. TaxID=1871063 RepID=UPI003D6BB316
MKLRLLAPAVAVALLLGGCTDDGGSPSDPSASNGEGKKLVEISPLTGKPLPDGRPDNSVFVVKVENTPSGAPQYGLDKADMVVEELVEGGLTRLAAFFYSNLPKKVGHVRSMRTTDIGIAKPVAGKIVASGGAPSAARRIKNAGINTFTESSPGFSRDAKAAPYNVVVNLSQLSSTAKGRAIPGPYLNWTALKGSDTSTPTPETTDSASSAPEPKKAKRVSVRFSNSTTTNWAFSGDHWKRKNGHAAPGQDFNPDTLVVMFCKVTDAGYRDPGGSAVPETVVKGSGRAVVLHDGTATEARWNKKGLGSTVKFETKDGEPLTIDPGKTWLSMVPKGKGGIDY